MSDSRALRSADLQQPDLTERGDTIIVYTRVRVCVYAYEQNVRRMRVLHSPAHDCE